MFTTVMAFCINYYCRYKYLSVTLSGHKVRDINILLDSSRHTKDTKGHSVYFMFVFIPLFIDTLSHSLITTFPPDNHQSLPPLTGRGPLGFVSSHYAALTTSLCKVDICQICANPKHRHTLAPSCIRIRVQILFIVTHSEFFQNDLSSFCLVVSCLGFYPGHINHMTDTVILLLCSRSIEQFALWFHHSKATLTG